MQQRNTAVSQNLQAEAGWEEPPEAVANIRLEMEKLSNQEINLRNP